MIKFDKRCTGCAGCEQVCPKDAISMNIANGFLYPQVDEKLCIDCGLCDHICHYDKDIANQFVKKAYAVKNKSIDIVKKSSSGGMFYALAKYVIQNGGVVFGASFDNDLHLNYDFTDNIENLDKFLTSKYLQSNVNGSFKKVKEFLQQGKKVLFCGTPCIVNGLQNYLQKPSPNLILVDFICHGIPNPKFFEKYVKELEKKYKSKLISFNFRYKKNGWEDYCIRLEFENGKSILKPAADDPYMKLFLKDIILRESCYNCNSRGDRRYSDITMADFWGIKDSYPNLYDKDGVSLVIINSKTGQDIFYNISDSIKFDEVDFEKKKKSNLSYCKSPENPAIIREKVYSNMDKYTVQQLADKFVDKISLKKKIRLFLGKIFKKIKRLFRKFITKEK